MANFLIIQDPDPARRAAFLEIVRDDGAPVSGLVRHETRSGDAQVLWWAAAYTPVSLEADDSGFAVLWGDALGESHRFLQAGDVRQAWSPPGSGATGFATTRPFDGYHAAVVFDAQSKTLVAGADLLGLFPIYHWSDPVVTLVASSPELMLRHPRFNGAIDTLGLAGLLLTERCVSGRTLFVGVGRLAPAHLLVRRAGEPAQEIRQHRFTMTDTCHELSFADQIALIDAESERSIRRLSRPNQRQAVLLSGGRDSRMIAAYLVDQGTRPAALTFGRSADHDTVCARLVSRRLGLTQHIQDYQASDYPYFSRQVARWEHGVNGFGSIMGWGMATALEGFTDRAFTGYFIDALISPSSLLPGSDFAAVYASHCSRGLGANMLTGLLRREVFGNALEQLEAEIGQTYERFADHQEGRGWCFYLYERSRFQIGSIPWRLSFGAWPVVPALDQRWMETLAGMPLESLMGRRAQDALLRRRFPELNRTPIARPSDDTTPLEPGLLRRVRNAPPMAALAARAGAWLRPIRRERRYHYRINDFNGEGWRAIRREADACRSKLHSLFDPRALDALLPSPETDLQFNDALLSASGLRTLVGVMLWAGEHL